MIGSNIRDRSLIVAAILFVLAVILIGCGGSGGGSSLTGGTTATAGTNATTTGSNSTGGAASTSILFKINWPASTRSLPPYANCVVLTIQRGSDAPIVQTINRVTKLAYTKPVTFDNLLPGAYNVIGQAFLDNDAQGALLANFSANVIVNAGNQVDQPLSFTSTLQSIVIDGAPFVMETGVTAELTGHAVDAQGDVLFLPPGSLTWSVLQGAALVDLTPVGFLSALAPGDVTVELTDPGSGDTAQASFTISGTALTSTNTTGTTDSTSSSTTGSTDATTTGTTDATTTGTTGTASTSTTNSTGSTGSTGGISGGGVSGGNSS